MSTTTETKYASYKGRTYRLLWSGKTKYGMKAKLGFVGGSNEFWADLSMVTLNAAAPTSSGNSNQPRRRVNSRGTYECEECGDHVYPGSRCWETGLKH
jgi:hypothetical protein